MLFAICPTCGRYAVGNAATPEEADQALKEWAAEHAPGVQTFDEEPPGWPRRVEGVRTNGHLAVNLQGKKLCSKDAEPWPCAAYVATARSCPANGLNLVPEAPAPDGG